MTKVIQLSHMIGGRDWNNDPDKTIDENVKQILDKNKDYIFLGLINEPSTSSNMRYAALLVDVEK